MPSLLIPSSSLAIVMGISSAIVYFRIFFICIQCSSNKKACYVFFQLVCLLIPTKKFLHQLNLELWNFKMPFNFWFQEGNGNPSNQEVRQSEFPLMISSLSCISRIFSLGQHLSQKTSGSAAKDLIEIDVIVRHRGRKPTLEHPMCMKSS